MIFTIMHVEIAGAKTLKDQMFESNECMPPQQLRSDIEGKQKAKYRFIESRFSQK